MPTNGHLGCGQIAALAFGNAIQDSDRTRLREHVSECDECGKKYEAVMKVINAEKAYVAAANVEDWDWEGICRKIVTDTRPPEDVGS